MLNLKLISIVCYKKDKELFDTHCKLWHFHLYTEPKSKDMKLLFTYYFGIFSLFHFPKTIELIHKYIHFLRQFQMIHYDTLWFQMPKRWSWFLKAYIVPTLRNCFRIEMFLASLITNLTFFWKTKWRIQHGGKL